MILWVLENKMPSKLYTAFKTKLEEKSTARVFDIDEHLKLLKNPQLSELNDYIGASTKLAFETGDQLEIQKLIITKLIELKIDRATIENAIRGRSFAKDLQQHLDLISPNLASPPKPATKKTASPPPPPPYARAEKELSDNLIAHIMFIKTEAEKLKTFFDNAVSTYPGVPSVISAQTDYNQNIALLKKAYDDAKEIQTQLGKQPPKTVAQQLDQITGYLETAERLEVAINKSKGEVDKFSKLPPIPLFSPKQQAEAESLKDQIQAIITKAENLKTFFDEGVSKNPTVTDFSDAQTTYNTNVVLLNNAYRIATDIRTNLGKDTSKTVDEQIELSRKQLEAAEKFEATINNAKNKVDNLLAAASTGAPSAAKTSTPPAPPPPLHKDIAPAMKQVETAEAEIQSHINAIQALLGKLTFEADLDGRRLDMQQHLQEAKNALVQNNKAKDALLALDKDSKAAVKTVNPADFPVKIAEQKKQIADALHQALDANAAADTIAKKDAYIPRMYKEKQREVSELNKQLATAKKEREAISSLHYAFLGTNKRSDLIKLDERIKSYESSLVQANKELGQWHKGNIAYDKEMTQLNEQLTSVAKNKGDVAQLERELAALNPPLSGAHPAPADEIQAKTQELNEAKIALENAEAKVKSTQSVILKQIESFKGSSRSSDTLLMERGGRLGFDIRVAKLSEVNSITGTTDDSTARVDISTTVKGGSDHYYLRTAVAKDEAIVATKTYINDDDGSTCQGALVQTKDKVRDLSKNVKNTEANDELAVQAAIMAVLNREKGSPIVLSGSDKKQIQKVHATLLWMQSQTKDNLLKIMGDKWHGRSKSELDLSDLKIISNTQGPYRAFKGIRQGNEDRKFIEEHMPNLNKITNYAQIKEQLISIKDEHKTSFAKDQVLGMPHEDHKGPKLGGS